MSPLQLLEKIDPEKLPDDLESAHGIIKELHRELGSALSRCSLLLADHYGPKSEKRRPAERSEQLEGLLAIAFNEAEFNKDLFPEAMPPTQESAAPSTADTVTVPAHTRKKAGRKPLPANLPREVRLIDLPEAEKLCSCGQELVKISEDVSEKLEYVPAQMKVLRTVRPNYTCPCCSKNPEIENPVKAAPLPPSLIVRGIISASLLAYLIVSKFCDALPFYRQEQMLKRLGVDLSRTTMGNAMIAVYADYHAPMLAEMERHLRSGPLLQIDETRVQVLHEPGRDPTQQSYMWVARGGTPGTAEKSAAPVILFRYDPSRASKVARAIIGEYQGIVQTDGYSGYNFLDTIPGVIHSGCLAHARREFVEAQKGSISKEKETWSRLALDRIGKVYHLEAEAKRLGLFGEALLKYRRENVAPVMAEFHQWLLMAEPKVPPRTPLGKAIAYSLNQWKQLKVFLDHTELTPDNNLIENAIRPFVVGRKNWMFCDSVTGAMASGFWYSLLETARANGLERWKYLRFVLERLPVCKTDAESAALLPWNLTPEQRWGLV